MRKVLYLKLGEWIKNPNSSKDLTYAELVELRENKNYIEYLPKKICKNVDDANRAIKAPIIAPMTIPNPIGFNIWNKTASFL